MMSSCFVHGHDEEMFFEFMRINDYSFQLKKNFFFRQAISNQTRNKKIYESLWKLITF